MTQLKKMKTKHSFLARFGLPISIRLVFIGVLLAMAASNIAHALTLDVKMKDGTSNVYIIDDSIKIKFIENTLCLDSELLNDRIALAKMESYNFSETQIGKTNEIHSDNGTRVKIVDGAIWFLTSVKDAELSVWDINGHKVISVAATCNDWESVSTERLSHGLYVIKVDGIVIKAIL